MQTEAIPPPDWSLISQAQGWSGIPKAEVHPFGDKSSNLNPRSPEKSMLLIENCKNGDIKAI